ncbi:uncharacterized protein [Mytilus edulis]|uniref:uncharacterized protein isoform X1 n=1 Tax=Mytilus edulis TaxID=6550 RepID=UPI0039EE9B09
MQETDEEQGGIIFQDRTGERARTRGLFPIVFMSNTTALQKIPAVQQLILPPLTSSARPSSLHLVLMPTKPRHISASINSIYNEVPDVCSLGPYGSSIEDCVLFCPSVMLFSGQPSQALNTTQICRLKTLIWISMFIYKFYVKKKK